ncbi:probable E3 ubiquitin-protein ligase LUL2 [Oryza brachyantha]|uniref:RING-type E3 ubiquitin transferase n=1 Tax=Oryza brachyantha TaxID=4533 RepID=J3L009_ORYBR|nr:probable E3 ubiquitin-protein ligase LUL2 [Oryza brachyantha]
MGNIASGGASPRPPPPPAHLDAYRHGAPPPYYHSYPRLPPGAAAPPPVPVPAQVERHRAVAVSVGVIVKGDTLRLVPDDGGRVLLLAFSFDADAPGSITVYFFAQEDGECALKATKEKMLQPVTVPFKEGRGQEFKQPCGSGIDVSLFEESELTSVGEGGVFPIAFKVEMDVSGNQESEGAHEAEESKSLVKYAIFVKKDNAEYGVQVVQQILWVDGIRYVLQEIYGIGNTANKNAREDDTGKLCVVCLSEPRDTAVLPCRHMCLCRECAQTLRYQTNKCPMCRQPVEGLREIEVDNEEIPQQGSQ